MLYSNPLTVAVIGTGFVGVVSAAAYASFGNTVVGLDIDEKKVADLQSGLVPFHEPGLPELLREALDSGNLTFTTDYKKAISNARVIIIAVGTPSKADGSADLTYVHAASEAMAGYLQPGAVVVVKSTVPPGTLHSVDEIIGKHTDVSYDLASVPEFLKEGTAVADTLKPDRVVIGATKDSTIKILSELHEPFNAEIVVVSPESAQMAKYAANSYLATRITFANQIANLCEHTGAQIGEVLSAIGLDQRIGSHYWYPGLGYGGSCFPKDVRELKHFAEQVGEVPNIFSAINELNEKRIPGIIEKLDAAVGGMGGKKIAVLGLAFKPNTDDMREAPCLSVIPKLVEKGAEVRGFDPAALSVARQILKEQSGLLLVDSLEQALEDADVVIVLIEWPEFVNFDYSMTKLDKKQWLFDARNQLDPAKVKSWGYEYIGIGQN